MTMAMIKVLLTINGNLPKKKETSRKMEREHRSIFLSVEDQMNPKTGSQFLPEFLL